MNMKVLNYCHNRKKCTKYETCAIMHRFHILYICSDFIFCTFAQVSYFVHLHRFYILYICTGFKFCTFAQVSNFVHLHRFRILYICTGFIFCTFAQISYCLHFMRLYSFESYLLQRLALGRIYQELDLIDKMKRLLIDAYMFH